MLLHVSLKGFGDSEKPYLARNYTDEVVIEELRKFVEVVQERARKIVVVGHGLGGQLGWKLASRHPDLVAKFVSVSTPHPRVWLAHLMRSWTSLVQVSCDWRRAGHVTPCSSLIGSEPVAVRVPAALPP